ncbi:hemerythrin domain-containing protein [Paracoccaceae bacterium GXU_MW_L88]
MDDTLTLGARDGWPEELLFLAQKHPPDTWQGHPGLLGTGEIWLGNHLYFRQIASKIAAELERLQNDGETSYDSGPALHRHLYSLLSGLDAHHSVEDNHYFPVFQQVEPRLIRAFEVLDADHHLIHDGLDHLAATTEDSLRRLGRSEGVMTSDQHYAVDALADALKSFDPLLRQHLDDEEEIVIPLILERAENDPEFGA